MNDRPQISIVTPSFNMLSYLKRCCASIGDQEDVRCEHIVADGGSHDGSAEWLRQNENVTAMVEPDKGMYDALNKGFRRARGDILGHLNCDEQYLPGALAFVAEYMARHPDIDVLFGDALLVRPDGSLIAYRKGFKPVAPLILAGPLYLFTAAMFMRRRVVEEGDFYIDHFKDVADVELIARLLRRGYRLRHVSRYLSVFTMTGANRGTFTDTGPERRQLSAMMPGWIRYCAPLLRVGRLIVKAASGAYVQGGPIAYSIYASDEATARTDFLVTKASYRWRTA
jgi:glycosyltransferase involved in cell wall biosynthesis